MTDVTLADAQAAAEGIRAAAEVIGRVRDVEVLVRCRWQQIDDLPDTAAEELKGQLAVIVRAWLAKQPQAIRPAFHVKTACERSADVYELAMRLPSIWEHASHDLGGGT